ncbi:NACHT domain-containing protein [Favolaschia claudopus]|uniref:NACHT domain-containing protein n=1 Tax=Favolaschia claudopus TaxID=2862362 RepID=A0AAV9Z268_9AGAR
MRRIDARLKSFHLEIIMSIDNKIDNSNTDAALRILYNASASDATHDASDSFTRAPCHPNTRVTILDHLTAWSKDTSDSAPQILWMHGPAGTGKSAIAQSFCEELQARTCLAGSFFFRRGHLSRKDATKLWPTIAYQLALISPSFKAALAMRLTSNPALVNKSLSAQLQRLIIDPYHDADTSDDCNLVIVIDGLDECEDEARQQEILCSLPEFLASLPRLRVFIASRPEAHIKKVFTRGVFSCAQHLNVQGSFEDVRVYLTDEFERIRATHAEMASISGPWPGNKIIRHLIRESSGHFVYAATVIRFVEDSDFDPVERLAIVTRLQSQQEDSNYVSPFSALDELYLQILSMVPSRPQLSRVLAVIAADYTTRLSITQIGQLLGLKPTEILLMIRRLHSLIEIKIEDRPDRPAGQQYLSVYHASFLDFLSDPSRSRRFHFSDEDRQNLATDTLEALSWLCPTIRARTKPTRCICRDISLNVCHSSQPLSLLQN